VLEFWRNTTFVYIVLRLVDREREHKKGRGRERETKGKSKFQKNQYKY
jgi:hypothetical protein